MMGPAAPLPDSSQPDAVKPEKGEGGGLHVRPFQGSDQEWDILLADFPEATFCHLGAWRSILERALGHDAFYRIAVDPGGSVRGIHPLVRVRSRLFGDYLVSMPFLSYGGPLGSPEARQLLGEDAAALALGLGVDLLEIRSRKPVPGGLRTSRRKLTVLKELPASEEELWEKGIKAKVRSQVRRPMKEGMEVRFGPEEMDSFYVVFSRTMRDLGTPVLPRAFFQEVARRLREEAVFCTVNRDGNPVAAGCGFLWGGEFEITWAGALREHSRSAPNMLLYWSLMAKSVQWGAHTFNFGRCSPDSGTHRFKRQWGGSDLPLPWCQWSPGEVKATPTPTGAKYGLATSIWRKLPLPVANALGPLLARSLP